MEMTVGIKLSGVDVHLLHWCYKSNTTVVLYCLKLLVELHSVSERYCGCLGPAATMHYYAVSTSLGLVAVVMAKYIFCTYSSFLSAHKLSIWRTYCNLDYIQNRASLGRCYSFRAIVKTSLFLSF